LHPSVNAEEHTRHRLFLHALFAPERPFLQALREKMKEERVRLFHLT